MPKNIPKCEHKQPNITNAEKLIKIGTKMRKNLPKWEQCSNNNWKKSKISPPKHKKKIKTHPPTSIQILCSPPILLKKVYALPTIFQLKWFFFYPKMPKNIPKLEHTLPKITNAEKHTKIGTKMSKNLPKCEPKLPKVHNCLNGQQTMLNFRSKLWGCREKDYELKGQGGDG